MIKEVSNLQVAKEMIQWVVKGYRDVFDALKKDRSYWVPDLMLELAQELANLEDKSWAKELVEESNQYWFQLRGIELNQNDNWFNTMKPLLTQNDSKYLEGLKNCWSLLQDNQNIDQTESLLTKLKQEKTMNFSETKIKALEVINAEDSEREVLRDDSGKFQKDLADLEDQIKTNRFTIGVVGAFNTGKSTFLNALLGQKLLPDSMVPETAVPTFLIYREKGPKAPQATAYYWPAGMWEQLEKRGKSEDQQDHESKITKMVKKVRTELGNRFNELITQEGKQEEFFLTDLKDRISARSKSMEAKLIYRVDVETQLDLCKDGIQIMDTPGLGDTERHREYLVEIFLQKCDLLVLFLDATRAFDVREEDFLEQQKRREANLFVVVNQIDQCKSDEDRKSVIERVNEHMTEIFAGQEKKIPKIFPMSALESLYRRTGQSPEGSKKWTDEQSGVPAFEKSLRKSLLEEGERARILQENWKHRLVVMVGGQIKQIKEHLAVLEKPINELAAKIEEVHKENDHLRVGLEKIKAHTNDELKRLESEYRNKVKLGCWEANQLAGPIAKEAEEKVENFFRGKSKKKDEIETWLEQKFRPSVGSSIQKGLKKVDSDTRNQINEAIEKFLKDVQQSYKDFERLEKGVKFSVQVPVKIRELDYWSLVAGNLVKFFAFGGAMGATGTALFSSASFLVALTGPLAMVIGATVGAVMAGLKVWRGNAKQVKNEIHKQLKEAIPQALVAYTGRWQQELLEQIPPLVKRLREIAEKPALEMQAEFEQGEADRQKRRGV